MNPNDRQVAGSHYAAGGTAQHWDYAIQALNNRYLEGQITKYVMRHRKKNGKQDLEKAMHFLDKLDESYRLGFVGPPVTYYPFNVHALVVNNGLNTDEAYIVNLMVRWNGPALDEVRRRIGQLMVNAEDDQRKEDRRKAGGFPGSPLDLETLKKGAGDPIGDKGACEPGTEYTNQG